MLFETPVVTDRERAVLETIDPLRRTLRTHLGESRPWEGALRRSATARAIHGSIRIEGHDAMLDDVAAIEMEEEPLDVTRETRLAYRGYGDAMTYIGQMADDDDVAYSEQLLKSLHFMITNGDLPGARSGRWRAGPGYVQEHESGEVVYEGPDVEDLPVLMHELIGRLRDDAGGSPIIHAAMAHLNLIMIHPFRKGSGRMARALQNLVLAREGVLPPALCSIEEYLGASPQVYYEVLARVGGGRWNPDNDARPWLQFVLTAHLRQARTLLRRVKEGERLWVDIGRVIATYGLPERVHHALFDAAIGMRVRNATYLTILDALGDETTEGTASRDVRQLIDAGLLTAHGERRARYYTAGAPLLRVRQQIIRTREPRDDADPFEATAVQTTLM